MLKISKHQIKLTGPAGSITLPRTDELTLKMSMLYEGECEGLGPTAAAEKYGFSRQRYFQLLQAYRSEGASALQSKPRGPKSNYRRTDELIRRVIRHRFVDPDASAEVIAQTLKQARLPIGIRSVERIIADFGLQKKTLRAVS